MSIVKVIVLVAVIYFCIVIFAFTCFYNDNPEDIGESLLYAFGFTSICFTIFGIGATFLYGLFSLFANFGG